MPHELHEYTNYLISIIWIIIISIILKRRKNKRFWVRKWIENRTKFGVYHQLLKELDKQDPKSFTIFFRMDRFAFNELVDRIRPWIEKSNTSFRNAIPIEERLAITLRFLATGKWKYCNNFNILQNILQLLIQKIIYKY